MKKIDDIPRTQANSRELRTIEMIAALERRIDGDGGLLEERLRSVPDLYRQYRIAQSAMSKVVDGLYDTLPLNTLLRLQRQNQNSEVVIRPTSVSSSSLDTKIVLEKDLRALVEAARISYCSMCINTGSELKECQLRKVLMSIAPPEELGKGYLCEYAGNEEL